MIQSNPSAWAPPLNEPVLTKRIPTYPWGNEADRHIVAYDEYASTGGYKDLEKAISMTPGELVDLVKAAGLRGRGGAGFPTGLKWSFLPPAEGSQAERLAKGEKRYLAINADESEPGTFKDRLLMDYDPHLMLEGIAIACYACQLDAAFVFIRGEYYHQARVVENAIKEAYAKGVFGGQGLLQGAPVKHDGQPFKVECYLHRGAGAYICGEETALLEAIEGKRGWPRIKPPFPAVKGLFGRPTIINTSRRSRTCRPSSSTGTTGSPARAPRAPTAPSSWACPGTSRFPVSLSVT